MAWGRFGDTSHSHRKVLRATARDPIRGAAVWGAVTLCLSWSTQESQDWWVSESFVLRTFGPEGPKLMREAQQCELVRPGRERRGGENGWLIDDSDPELLHIRTKAEVDADREAAKATRQKEPRREVRLRDGDQCRYCGKTVSWRDRVSKRSGTYDHPDPNDRDTFVVACKGCNTAKYDRTVEQWIATGRGLPLLREPDAPLIGADTAEQFGVTPTDPAALRAHTGTQPADAATPDAAEGATTPTGPEAATGAHGQPDAAAGANGSPIRTAAEGATGDLPDLDLSTPRVADLPASGRDGPGRAGSGVPAVATHPPARTRGTRGQRKKQTSPAQPSHAQEPEQHHAR